MFHVKHLFGFQGVEGVQQLIQILHPVVFQFDAALFPAGNDAAAPAQTATQFLGGLLGIIDGEPIRFRLLRLGGAVSFFTSCSVCRTDSSSLMMVLAADSCMAGERGE